jgi:midasin (ATPase involved in ribosome maturation)
MGQLEHIVEIFIDSQADHRTLIGAYVCSDIPGEFTWRAGRVFYYMYSTTVNYYTTTTL